MSKKLFTLVSTLVDCAGTAACALVAYFQPHWYGAIIVSIGIATTAINDIMAQFITPDK